MEARLQQQLRADDAVVERGVAARKEDALVVSFPPSKVGADDVVDIEHLVPIFEERDDADGLGVELADPFTDGGAVREVAALLPRDELLIVISDARNFVRSGRERQNHLLDGRFEVALVELAGDIIGGGDALQRLDEELAHLHLDRGVRHSQRDDRIAPQLLLCEELRVGAQQLLHHVGIGILAFRIPHLLVAAERKMLRCFGDLAVALQHPVNRIGGRLRVVGMLGAHNLGDKGHVCNLGE